MKAIVTGHTKGLGEAIASDLLMRDIPVLGLARTFSHEMQARCPGLLSQIEIDLADAAALGNWLAGSALRHFLAGANAILLINNAGVVQPVGTLLDQDPLAIARAVTLNIAAPLMLSAAVAALSTGAERRILHIFQRGRAQRLSWLERLLRHQGRARPACARSGARRRAGRSHLQPGARRYRYRHAGRNPRHPAGTLSAARALRRTAARR